MTKIKELNDFEFEIWKLEFVSDLGFNSSLDYAPLFKTLHIE